MEIITLIKEITGTGLYSVSFEYALPGQMSLVIKDSFSDEVIKNCICSLSGGTKEELEASVIAALGSFKDEINRQNNR